MSERTHILYYVLWIAHPALQLGIAALMLRRGMQRKFPFFFGYVLTQLVEFAVIFPTTWHQQNYAASFYAYWTLMAFSVAFGFGVIHEVFVDVFRSFHTLRDLGTVLFKWAGLVMLLVALVVSVSANSTSLPPWMDAIMTTHRCVRVIQVGMVLFLLFFARYMGVRREQQSFGIALGFGWYALVELALVASWTGKHLGNPWISIVNMAAYNVSLLLWMAYCAFKNSARQASNELFQSQRWEQSLTDLHHPMQGDSLIPMFEGMVDRALSRTRGESLSPHEKRPVGGASWHPEVPGAGFGVPKVGATSKK